MTPQAALAMTRAPFSVLPIDLAGKDCDLDALESNWRLLGTMRLEEIILNPVPTGVSMVKCWSEVSEMKNGLTMRFFSIKNKISFLHFQ